MSSVPKPPSDLGDMHVVTLAAGTELCRFHHQDYAGNQFNPGAGRSTRFHPLHDSVGAVVPTLYAGASLTVSAYEYVFHDIPFDRPVKSVYASQIATVAFTELITKRPLRLATLFEPDLNRWRTTRAQLIDTPPTSYAETVRWAEAIHRTHGDVDGLVWTSRRADEGHAYILFGDRVSPADLEVARTVRIGGDAGWMERLNDLGRRSGIRIILG